MKTLEQELAELTVVLDPEALRVLALDDGDPDAECRIHEGCRPIG